MTNFEKVEKKLVLRPANLDDAVDILNWRNDVLSRKMSGNTNVIAASDHISWFKNALDNQRMLLLIACMNEKNDRLGMVRFDFDHTFSSAEISININPEYRRQGHGRVCLTEAKNYISHVHPQCQYIDAAVRVENNSSARAFLAAGYEEISRKGEFILYRRNLDNC